MAFNFSAKPKAVSRTRLLPKVLLSMISAPARTYSVNLLHHLRRRQIQFIETAVNEDALRVKHGAHGAIGHEDFGLQFRAKFGGPG